MLEYNEQWDFGVKQIPYIVENIDDIRTATLDGVERFKHAKGIRGYQAMTNNITWYFKDYNVYSLCACNTHFYKLYTELVQVVREYFEISKKEKPNQLWLQSWINSHKSNDTLKSHNHEWPIHGYVSIDPMKTQTVFTDKPNGVELYRVDNKVGQIYIGPGFRYHHVEVLEPFKGDRITYGYDLEFRERILENMGLIPVVL